MKEAEYRLLCANLASDFHEAVQFNLSKHKALFLFLLHSTAVVVPLQVRFDLHRHCQVESATHVLKAVCDLE